MYERGKEQQHDLGALLIDLQTSSLQSNLSFFNISSVELRVLHAAKDSGESAALMGLTVITV